jgi:hypothetical protein
MKIQDVLDLSVVVRAHRCAHPCTCMHSAPVGEVGTLMHDAVMQRCRHFDVIRGRAVTAIIECSSVG